MHSITVKGYGDPHVSTSAFYFTVGWRNGSPELLFFNSKEMESFHWISALMTAYSRQLCSDGVAAVVKDMKKTFSPHGKYVAEGFGEVNSVVHHLGLLLERLYETA